MMKGGNLRPSIILEGKMLVHTPRQDAQNQVNQAPVSRVVDHAKILLKVFVNSAGKLVGIGSR